MTLAPVEDMPTSMKRSHAQFGDTGEGEEAGRADGCVNEHGFCLGT